MASGSETSSSHRGHWERLMASLFGGQDTEVWTEDVDTECSGSSEAVRDAPPLGRCLFLRDFRRGSGGQFREDGGIQIHS